MLFKELMISCIFLFGTVSGISAYLKVVIPNPSTFFILGFLVLIGMAVSFCVDIIHVSIVLLNMPAQ
jgi:hypothetical protein